MNAPLKLPTIEHRIARCLRDINAVRRVIEGVRYDLEWIAGAALTPSCFETDMLALSTQMQFLADHAREIVDSARRRREDGAEADQRIDQLIAGTVQ